VTANSPAAKAGIQVGDVILRLNKQDNLSIREMMQIISDTKPNTEVIITISRLGNVIDLPVIIEELPSN
jgi:protease degS